MLSGQQTLGELERGLDELPGGGQLLLTGIAGTAFSIALAQTRTASTTVSWLFWTASRVASWAVRMKSFDVVVVVMIPPEVGLR
jgi:hypothetical protein